MATLVGQDGTTFVTPADTAYGAGGGRALWMEFQSYVPELHGFQPLANGNATTAYVYIADFGTANNVKVAVYRQSDRVLLAQSADIAAGGGTGLRSASITYTTSVSTRVYLAVISDNAGIPSLRYDSTGADYLVYEDPMTYAALDDPLPAGTETPGRAFIIYLDGTVTGGSSKLLLQLAQY